MINQRIKKLREQMALRGIDIYIVPTADFHESEYVGEFFKARKFITGFTGSAGTAVITMTEANLWTDGRYFVQAAAELKDSDVILRRMGEEGVPYIPEYVQAQLPEGRVIGFDGRVVNAGAGKAYARIAEEKGGSVKAGEDLVGIIWEDRPLLSCQPAWILGTEYCGRSTAEKLAEIRSQMQEKGCEELVISCLYDIAWILNLRGDDISYVPVILSYLVIRRGDCLWFVQEGALSGDVRAYLQENGIQTAGYDDFYAYLPQISGKTWVDSGVLNYRAYHLIQNDCIGFDGRIPSEKMRALKNPVEMENTILAHRKDAVAEICFMRWLKENVGPLYEAGTPLTEISASDQLARFRAEQEDFLGLSFSTIPGYAEHGAIVHYHATEDTDSVLKPEGLYLVDSGGHYLQGTTDITRTFALGPVTDEMKADFTRVVRANRRLAAAKFRYGCTGEHLDVIARMPFWEDGLDYNHGTGHGIGFILNVHEGPQSIRWNGRPGTRAAVFEEGMITSDEPGLYLEGKYGIRIEDELLCRRGPKTSFGQFMYFEDITYVPIDLDAVEPTLMSAEERKLLNDYHENVYQVMKDYFDEEMRAWLRQATRAV